jgi:hypothetical protein
MYGGAIGIVAAYSQAFVFSPGFTFVRTDVSDYGNMIGIAIPFEWTTNRGLRFGLEIGFGRAFGGVQRYTTCSSALQCDEGVEESRNRDAGRAFSLRFELGFGFNHPQPQKAAL